MNGKARRQSSLPVVGHGVVDGVSDEPREQRTNRARHGQQRVLQIRGDAQHRVGLGVRILLLLRPSDADA